jgi:hypothetical protein
MRSRPGATSIAWGACGVDLARRSISCQKYIIDQLFGIAQLDAPAIVNTSGVGAGIAVMRHSK